jgi:hypothetical protein
LAGTDSTPPASVLSSNVGDFSATAQDIPAWPQDTYLGQLDPDSIAQVMRRIPACGAKADIRPHAIGPLDAGATVAQVLARCPGALPYWELEEDVGIPILAINVAGVLVLASFDSAHASAASFRLHTADSRALTAQGVGPNSTLGMLKAAYGAPQFIDEECALFAVFEALPSIAWWIGRPVDMGCTELDDAVTAGGSALPNSLRAITVRVGAPER